MSNNFRFYFNFISIPLVGRIEITEPVGFDAESFKIEQEKGRFAKDVYSSNEDSMLTIYKGHFQFLNIPEMNPYGTVYEHASMGIDYFYYLDTHFGTESKVEFIFEKDGEETKSMVDFKTIIIKDGEISFKTIQDNNRKLINQKKDTSINAFSYLDLDGNIITPCDVQNVLIKAHPLTQKSKWVSGTGFEFRDENGGLGLTISYAFNTCRQIINYGCEDTLTFLDSKKSVSREEGDFLGNTFKIFQAKYNSTNCIVNINNFSFRQKTGRNGDGDGYLKTKFRLVWGYDVTSPIDSHSFFDFQINEDEEFIYNNNLEFTIPSIPSGASIWLFFLSNLTQTTELGINTIIFAETFLSNFEVELKITSTALDSVAKGIRYIDLVRHNVMSIKSGVTVDSSLYGSGGQHYDNYCFNGNMLGKKTDTPFNNKLEDLLKVPFERCCDYKIQENNIIIEHYNHFYKDMQLAEFTDVNSDNEIECNDRYLLKGLDFGYEKSSFDRTGNDANTNDDVHTYSEWLVPTKEHNNIYEVKIKHIRSQKLIEEQRKKSILEKKAQENDESLFVIKCESLPLGSRSEFTYRLKHFGDSILTNGSFSWNTLGFDIGDSIIINNSSYVVVNIIDNVLKISGNIGEGESLLTINYPLTNVNLVTSTNKDYINITGIDIPNGYANLDYSIKRNIIDFYPILGTACENLAGKKIKNTLFRVNGKLETQKVGETSIIEDSGNIDINTAILARKITKKKHNISVYCEYTKAKQLINDFDNNEGYISFTSINGKQVKGYPVKLDYVWRNEELELELEEKSENYYLTITKTLGLITVTEKGYISQTGLSYYEIFNNFVNLYDSNEVRLNRNIISFEFIKINGVLYTDIVSFTNALENVLL